MDKTNILCFPAGVSVKTIKERQNLDEEKTTKLNQDLNRLINNRNFSWLDLQEFNKTSALYVNFKCGNNFYSIELKYDGKDVFFESSFRMFDDKNFDSDDEEDNKLTSYHFVPSDRLYPKKSIDGKCILTLDMYFDFVQRCITTEPFYVKKK